MQGNLRGREFTSRLSFFQVIPLSGFRGMPDFPGNNLFDNPRWYLW